MTMEDNKGNVINNFEAGSNCQVFNAPISGCIFAMPGSNVTQQQAPTTSHPAERSLSDERLTRAIEQSQAYFGAIVPMPCSSACFAMNTVLPIICRCSRQKSRGYPIARREITPAQRER